MVDKNFGGGYTIENKATQYICVRKERVNDEEKAGNFTGNSYLRGNAGGVYADLGVCGRENLYTKL